MYNIMISAGEASGDSHAAHVLDALNQRGTGFQSFGMGAGHLEQSGTELIVDCRDLSVIGFVDVLLNYHRFLKRLNRLRTEMRARKPDLLVLVDFPDFNLKLADTAKALNIPVLFYVSPSVWAWRPKRIHKIGRLVDHMAVLFPFEVPYYERESIPVTYVGNPVVADAHSEYSVTQARIALNLDEQATTIALLPGSRPGEIARILPAMVDAAARIPKDRKHPVQFVLPKAATIEKSQILNIIGDSKVDIALTEGDSYTVMRASDLVICASGTATLETALIGTPMILVYKLAWLNYQLMKRLIQIPDIGLVNIVAGKRIVPELLQNEVTGTSIANTAVKLLDDSKAMDAMRHELRIVKETMGDGGASGRVADLIPQLIAARPG